MIEWIKMLLLCLRLGSNPQSAELVNAEVVTKRETLTIGEIFSYIKDGSNKVRLGLIISWSFIKNFESYIALLSKRLF